MRLDLELGEVDEHLLEVGASKCEVFDDSIVYQVGKVVEDITEQDTTILDIDSFNAIPNLNHLFG